MKKYILILSSLVIVFSLGLAVTLINNPGIGLTVVLAQTESPTPTPVPVDGMCSVSVNGCTQGVFFDEVDSGTDYLWSCVGIDGGATASCSSPIGTPTPTPTAEPTPTPTPTPDPVNGVCGASINSCTAGSLFDSADNSTDYLWMCTGWDGGTTASCSSPIPPTGPDELMGWAWSSNIGWISFNSKNSNSGGGNYQVIIEDTGALDGYAWSSNIGWIRFNPSESGCPTGSCPPMVNLTTGAVTGWARVLSDGNWIELSGTNHASPVSNGTGGVTLNTTTKVFNGYAWESDYIGWLSFNANSSTVPPVTIIDVATPSLTGSCIMTSGTQSGVAGRSIVFQATPTGTLTTLPYHYDWAGGLNTYNYTAPSTPGSYSSPTVTITDSSTPTPVTSALISCVPSSITVEAPIAPDQLDLFIGATASTTGTKTEYVVTTGKSFALKWRNSLSADMDTGYSDCEKVITAVSGTVNNGWSTQWTQSIAPGSEAGVNGLSATTPGTYDFKIICTNNADSNLKKTATSRLKVRSAIEGEI